MGRVDWKSNNFDLDLDFGHKGEDYISNIFENNKTKIEVKTDRLACKTGNLAIEISCWGKPSGLSTSTADYWIINICNSDASIKYSLIYQIESLKNLIRKHWKQLRKVKGGDGNFSKMVLVPLKLLI